VKLPATRVKGLRDCTNATLIAQVINSFLPAVNYQQKTRPLWPLKLVKRTDDVLVVFLCRAASDQLHALGYNVLASLFHQEVNVVGCHRVIEHRKTKAFLRLENPVQVRPSIARSERWNGWNL
jgi:hypothetical protein